MLLAAKLAIPLAMATVGVGATAAAVVTHDGAATQVSTAAQVWIDAPTGEEAVAPGAIHVGAHATAEGSIGTLDLYVDGKKVASDSTLERNEKLVYGTFEWDAAEGEHRLVVAQPGSDRRSAPVDLLVTTDQAATTSSTSTTTSTTSAGSTTTSGSTTTTTTGPDENTTTTGPPMVTVPGETTPPATVVPTTRPPTTVPPTQPAPIIDGAAMNGSTVYRLSCGYPDIVVTARARNATSAQVLVDGTGFSRAMNRNGASFTGTIPSGVWGTGDVGQHTVTVVVQGPGGRTQANAGTVDIRMTCPKD